MQETLAPYRYRLAQYTSLNSLTSFASFGSSNVGDAVAFSPWIMDWSRAVKPFDPETPGVDDVILYLSFIVAGDTGSPGSFAATFEVVDSSEVPTLYQLVENPLVNLFELDGATEEASIAPPAPTPSATPSVAVAAPLKASSPLMGTTAIVLVCLFVPLAILGTLIALALFLRKRNKPAKKSLVHPGSMAPNRPEMNLAVVTHPSEADRTAAQADVKPSLRSPSPAETVPTVDFKPPALLRLPSLLKKRGASAFEIDPTELKLYEEIGRGAFASVIACRSKKKIKNKNKNKTNDHD